MKKITILLFTVIIFFSCAQEPESIITDPVPPAESELLGTWNRNSNAWDFYANGEFAYYDWITGDINNYGFYLDDPTAGLFYVEDYISGDYGFYLYQVLYDYPGVGDITLLMAPDFAPGNVTEWGKVK